MRKPFFALVILIAVIAAAGFNCATSRPSISILMHPDLQTKGSSVSAAWLGYGTHKALWRSDTFFKKNPDFHTYAYTFSEEVACRNTLAQMWIEMKPGDSISDPYLDDLAAVAKAGFMNEYVWQYFKQADWVKPADLHEEQYESWARENIPKHECVSMVRVTSGEKANEPAPRAGQELLNRALGEIYDRHYLKAESLLRQLSDGTPANWQACVEAGDTLQCAFWDTAEFNQCVRENPQKTVIASFTSYSRAVYLLAFLALETGDADKALSFLNNAMKLQPDHPVILLERATVLSRLKKPQEAYDCFVLAEKPHYALTIAMKARALRGQGMTLIDLDRLDEAEICLENSLKYDPDSDIVPHEMDYIRALRTKRAAPGAGIMIRKVKNK